MNYDRRLSRRFYFTEIFMDKENICSCCRQHFDASWEAELTEACRVYRIIQNITSAGCDAEVKKVKGELKILSVKKSVASDFTAKK